MCCCKSDKDHPEPPPVEPNTCLVGNEITISAISGIPDFVTFDKIRATVTGKDWQVIAIAEAAYSDGQAVLTLPQTFAQEELMKAAGTNDAGAPDYSGYWYANTDNAEARVAALGDIMAYSNGERVGRIWLGAWEHDESSTVDKPFIFYQYADRPFALSGTYGSYRFETSFKAGWEPYAKINMTEQSQYGSTLCTTAIPVEPPLFWHFESWVYPPAAGAGGVKS